MVLGEGMQQQYPIENILDQSTNEIYIRYFNYVDSSSRGLTYTYIALELYDYNARRNLSILRKRSSA